VWLNKQVLTLLENVKPGDLISVDGCDASLADRVYAVRTKINQVNKYTVTR
jgi:hypothetical protein